MSVLSLNFLTFLASLVPPRSLLYKTKLSTYGIRPLLLWRHKRPLSSSAEINLSSDSTTLYPTRNLLRGVLLFRQSGTSRPLRTRGMQMHLSLAPKWETYQRPLEKRMLIGFKWRMLRARWPILFIEYIRREASPLPRCVPSGSSTVLHHH